MRFFAVLLSILLSQPCSEVYAANSSSPFLKIKTTVESSSSVTLAPGEVFSLQVSVHDSRDNPAGLVSLWLNIDWDPELIEVVHSGFNPSSAITRNFPLMRGGELDNETGKISELSGAFIPGTGREIGKASFEEFALIKFRARAETSHSEIKVSLGKLGAEFLDISSTKEAEINNLSLTIEESASESDCHSANCLDIGTNSAGYQESGRWHNSSLPGAGGSSTRYSADPSARATWSAESVSASGFYQVSIYRVAHQNSTPLARIEITHQEGVSSKYLDYSSGESAWISLGTFAFSGSSNEQVSVTNAAGTGYLRADAVRFELVNELSIDNDDRGYQESGTWYNSSLAGQNGSRTRYSASPAATARWTTSGINPGNYSVMFYKVAYPGSTSQAQITVNSQGRVIGTVEIDLSSGSSGWVDLGDFFFDGVSDEYIEISNLSGEGYLRADAVRLVFSPPSSVTHLIDNEEFAYREYGAWSGSALSGADGTPTRYSSDADASVQYSASGVSPGTYEVSVYKIVHPNSTAEAAIEISHQDGLTRKSLAQNSGEQGWVSLGTFSFRGSSQEGLNIFNASSGFLRADAVRFTPLPNISE